MWAGLDFAPPPLYKVVVISLALRRVTRGKVKSVVWQAAHVFYAVHVVCFISHILLLNLICAAGGQRSHAQSRFRWSLYFTSFRRQKLLRLSQEAGERIKRNTIIINHHTPLRDVPREGNAPSLTPSLLLIALFVSFPWPCG